ncbi:MAG: CorA family divalent cation transporter, partial [Clostridium sp.]
MLQIYKTTENGTHEIDTIEQGSWINLKNPSEEELTLVSEKTGLYLEFLKAALDEEETSRLDFEDAQHLVIVDIPFMDVENNSVQYHTIPLGIILNDNYIVTVCLRDSRIIEDFMHKKVKNF